MSWLKPYVSPLDIERLPNDKLYEHAWTASMYHLLTKTVVGLGVGVGLSVVLFKRRTWPIAFATGTGFGMAYTEATHLFWAVEQKLARNSQ
jgi:inner membrane organizing system protein 1